MGDIKWIQSGTKKVPHYRAKIGCIELVCRGYTNEWRCSVYFGNTWVKDTNIRVSLERALKDAERFAIEYLFGCGFVVLKELKKIGFLEEMLSEVGIDL